MNKINNRKQMGVVARAKKSVIGRLVCRVLGEETGAVMMEYVIVAVLIAAAVAAGAFFFGKDIVNMFGVAGQAVTADHTNARNNQTGAQTASLNAHAEAANQANNYIKTENETVNDNTAGGEGQ